MAAALTPKNNKLFHFPFAILVFHFSGIDKKLISRAPLIVLDKG